MGEETRDKDGRLLWCPVCGDSKACFHRPDAVVEAAFWSETKAAAGRRSGRPKSSLVKEEDDA